MKEIIYFDRVTQTEKKEKVYGQFFLTLLYADHWWNRLISLCVLPLIAKIPFFSYLYGALQKRAGSKRKVLPFIQKFEVDAAEFLDPPTVFSSFNDFFIRRLNLSSRPFAAGDDVAILPADARYLVFPNLKNTDTFWVKGQQFSLERLLKNDKLAALYAEGSMVIARLCPVDYHRFHFPCDAIPSDPQPIDGPLFSVNPIALRRNLDILTENKRSITTLQTSQFGKVLFIEVGATYVGSIHQTYEPGKTYFKGDEKGYFSFGGSCLILLFEPDVIEFAPDLIEYSSKTIEVRGLVGQFLGRRRGASLIS